MKRWKEFYHGQVKSISLSIKKPSRKKYDLYAQMKTYRLKEGTESGLMIFIPVGADILQEVFDAIKER